MSSRWDRRTRIPRFMRRTTRGRWTACLGGSSGGPAAAVAADECMFALGSDTGVEAYDSLPSLCGIVGMKPTYGLVSRFGLVAFASSLDQIGPLTKDVRDCAITLNAIAGNDANGLDLAEHGCTGLLRRRWWRT